MALNFFKLLVCFYLRDKVITNKKDEGVNLNTLMNALTNNVSCVLFLLVKPCVINCYGHEMSKCCQHATNNLKMCGEMSFS
jgi:hypothetical protein